MKGLSILTAHSSSFQRCRQSVCILSYNQVPFLAAGDAVPQPNGQMPKVLPVSSSASQSAGRIRQRYEFRIPLTQKPTHQHSWVPATCASHRHIGRRFRKDRGRLASQVRPVRRVPPVERRAPQSSSQCRSPTATLSEDVFAVDVRRT